VSATAADGFFTEFRLRFGAAASFGVGGLSPPQA